MDGQCGSLWQFLSLPALGLESSDVDLPVGHSGAVSLHQSLHVHTAQRHPAPELGQSQPETLEQQLSLAGGARGGEGAGGGEGWSEQKEKGH